MHPELEAIGLSKAFAVSGSSAGLQVLDDVSFHVDRGEFFVVVGPSGCGKTTLINILGGFVHADAGGVWCRGAQVTGPATDRVVVFQDYALFEWRTVLANVTLPLRAKGLSRAERDEVAGRYLEMVHLSDAHGRHPYQLSGGMKQRLALARALAVDPQCLLLDEPLVALDYQLRILMAQELLGTLQAIPKTVLMVTHDLEDAVYLADRIMILTPRPARVKEILEIDLPRPRRPELRTAQRFQRIKRHVLTRLVESAK